MPTYNLKINGKSVSVNADEDTPLLWVLRDELNMVGTKFGCGISQCGACTCMQTEQRLEVANCKYQWQRI